LIPKISWNIWLMSRKACFRLSSYKKYTTVHLYGRTFYLTSWNRNWFLRDENVSESLMIKDFGKQSKNWMNWKKHVLRVLSSEPKKRFKSSSRISIQQTMRIWIKRNAKKRLMKFNKRPNSISLIWNSICKWNKVISMLWIQEKQLLLRKLFLQFKLSNIKEYSKVFLKIKLKKNWDTYSQCLKIHSLAEQVSKKIN